MMVNWRKASKKVVNGKVWICLDAAKYSENPFIKAVDYMRLRIAQALLSKFFCEERDE
jgi:hypothetical protein